MGFIDVNELPFTPEQLDYFEKEMKKYKVPLLYKWVFGFLYKYGAIAIPLLLVVIMILGLIYGTGYHPNLWPVIKTLALGYIFGLGSLVLISFLWNRIKVLVECKRLGLTLKQWDLLAIAFQIKYI